MIVFLAKYWRLIAIGSLVLLVGAQGRWISSLRHDLTSARAALVNPVTHRTWEQDLATSQRNLDICHGSVQEVQVALDRQTASVAALGAQGEARAKMLLDGLEGARKGRAEAVATARALSKPPAGIDSCARGEAARRAVLESLG